MVEQPEAEKGPEALIVLPEDWWVIPLTDPETRKRSVKKFVEKLLGSADVDATTRAELRNSLLEATALAADQGGRLQAISLHKAEEHPFIASLTVFREPITLESVKIRLQMSGADAVVAPSEYGPVLREVRTDIGDEFMGIEQVEQLFVDYWLDPSDGYGIYRASFATPYLELQAEVLELFDAIVSSVTVYRPSAADAEPASE